MHSETTNPSGREPALSGYEVLEKIGEGGTGEVFRARQLSLGREVALKLLRPPLAANPWCLEPKVMASLSHPNVVAVHDFIQSPSSVFLVLEYIAGMSLRGLLVPGEPWPAERALPILNAAASALTFIHQRGLLHLDLKPENVLCGPGGQPIKIADFGLARPQSDGQSRIALDSAQGTFDYCAPEQRFGLGVSVRTDLFALATIAYELLTGKLPGRVYLPANQRNPLFPAAIDDVLRPALARHPEDRTATVAEFQRGLNRVLQCRRAEDRLT